jgi:hypothetical protein
MPPRRSSTRQSSDLEIRRCDSLSTPQRKEPHFYEQPHPGCGVAPGARLRESLKGTPSAAAPAHSSLRRLSRRNPYRGPGVSDKGVLPPNENTSLDRYCRNNNSYNQIQGTATSSNAVAERNLLLQIRVTCRVARGNLCATPRPSVFSCFANPSTFRPEDRYHVTAPLVLALEQSEPLFSACIGLSGQTFPGHWDSGAITACG